jgi:hypothetical protein
VAQVVARELGISMELIKLKASSAITSPNNTTTGGSMGSEMNCFVSFYRIFSGFFLKVAFIFYILELLILFGSLILHLLGAGGYKEMLVYLC